MGRNAVPSVLKDQDRSKRAPNEREPVFDPVHGAEAPAFLLPEGQGEWNRLADALAEEGLLTEADLGSFAGYCATFGAASRMWNEVGKAFGTKPSGTMIAALAKGTDDQKAMVGAALELMKQARMMTKDYVATGAKFGLNPSSRANLIGNEDTGDGWGDLLGGE